MYQQEDDDFYTVSSRRFGLVVARLRVKYRLSRGGLVDRLDLSLALQNNTRYHRMLSEKWLARLENGELAKPPVWLIPLLRDALNLSWHETTQLLDCVVPDVGIVVRYEMGPAPDAQPMLPSDNTPSLKLTPRQKDVLRLGARGLISREIADQLTVSKETVDTHWNRIREKTGITNRQEIILWAQKHGLV